MALCPSVPHQLDPLPWLKFFITHENLRKAFAQKSSFMQPHRSSPGGWGKLSTLMGGQEEGEEPSVPGSLLHAWMQVSE